MNATMNTALGAQQRALKWVQEHLDQFDPFTGGEDYDSARGQRLAELSIMLRVCSVCGTELPAGLEDGILDLLERTQRTPEFRARLVRKPDEWVLFGHVYGVLHAAGREDSVQRSLLERSLECGYLSSHERFPHQEMEVQLALALGELENRWHRPAQSWQRSILSDLPSPHLLDRAGLYATSHCLMFACGLGYRRPDADLPRLNQQRYRRFLSILLVRLAHEREWDLLGELLLAWSMLDLAPSAIWRQAWKCLLAAQRLDGSFPPRERQGQKESGEPSDPFARRYHTTLVAIMASAYLASRHPTSDRAEETSPEPGGPDPEGPDRGTSEPGTFRSAGLNAALEEAVRRAAYWLRGLAANRRTVATMTPVDACRCLIGLWIGEQIRRESTAELRDVVGRTMANADTDAWEQVPPTLKLMTRIVLAARGYAVDPLEAFWSRVTTTLNERLPADPHADRYLTDKRLLLHRTGAHPAIEPLPLAEALRHAEGLNLAGDSVVEELIVLVERVALFGTRRPTPTAPAALWALLEGLIAAAVNRYDLVAAHRLLRSRWHLAPEDREGIEHLCRALLLHQSPDGPIGFYGPELADLNAQGIDGTLALLLPATVAGLWTLAEICRPGWNLFAHLAVDPPPRLG